MKKGYNYFVFLPLLPNAVLQTLISKIKNAQECLYLMEVVPHC